VQGSILILDPIKHTEIANNEFELVRPCPHQFCQLFGSTFELSPGPYEFRFHLNNKLVSVLHIQA
jgi:hypothetical protein